jgi:hypothetical protein
MTIKSNQLFFEGRGLWNEYINLNGYAFEPSTQGISKLSKHKNLTKKYIKERINAFLAA